MEKTAKIRKEASAEPLTDATAREFFLEPFQDFLAVEQGLSPRTREAYALDLARFATYAAVKGSAGPARVAPRLLREYMYHLKDIGLSPASIRRNVPTT